MSRKATVRMLIGFAKTEYPELTNKECAKWLTTHMSDIRKAVRVAAKDAVTQAAIQDRLDADLEGWK